MIKSFGNKTAQDIFQGKASSRHARLLPTQHHQRASDLLELMDASMKVTDFKVPISNRLHKLKDDLSGFWSISVRDGWRIIFRFEDGSYRDVQIVDYH